MSIVVPPLKLARPSQLYKKYKLHIVQNPIRARCCGFGEKDKRPVDPPPILKLTAESEEGEPIKLNAKDSVLFLVHCQLYNENGTIDRALVRTISSPSDNHLLQSNTMVHKDKPEYIRNLIGSVVSNACYLYDENNIPGIFFIFQDLSVRLEGTYTLKFLLINLEEGDPLTMSTHVRLDTTSEPFTVYSAKKFPGMTESTALSRCFAKQGIKIPVRMSVQKSAEFSVESVSSSSQEKSRSVKSILSIENILLPKDNKNEPQ